MKRIKVLLIDQYHYWTNPANYTSPHLLDPIVDLKIFGPGFVNEEDLKKGLKKFVDKNKGFDVYISTANFSFRKSKKDWDNFRNSYLVKTAYIPYNVNHFRYIEKIEEEFELLSGLKVVFFMNQDLYNLTNSHISVLEKKYDYVVAPNQSIYPKKSYESLSVETFPIDYSKYQNWHSFCSKYSKRIFPLTHFTFKDEFDYSSIYNRKNNWTVTGAEYISRVIAKKKLTEKKLLKQESKLYKLLFNFLDKRFLTKRAFLDFKKKSFFNSFKDSKYCYTCISKLEFPLNKIFEIPTYGSLLVMPENLTVKNLGFKSMKNCIFTDPENIIQVNDWLTRNQEKASQIANEGRNFVLNNHTLESRSADLLKFLKKILNKTYKGAYWQNGKITFR